MPSPEHEIGADKAAAAWAGGLHGRQVIDRFLPIMANLLSPRGRAYVVLVRENKVGEVARAGLELGLSCGRVAGIRAMNERLMVVKFQRIEGDEKKKMEGAGAGPDPHEGAGAEHGASCASGAAAGGAS